eukprot:symbB.v1.2.032697.t1/scaffold3960.1/size47443/3
MAVVFAKLGLATLLQDIPLLLVQVYVWLVWRNLAPKVSLLCFGLGVQSILTTIVHHVFSRSQRAAYERVVKLLGVRRLTAGFFDVSAGVGTQAGKGEGGLRVKKTADDPGSFMAEGVDPTKLDPIQAAMYVAQMYDKRPEPRQEEELSSQDTVNRAFWGLSLDCPALRFAGHVDPTNRSRYRQNVCRSRMQHDRTARMSSSGTTSLVLRSSRKLSYSGVLGVLDELFPDAYDFVYLPWPKLAIVNFTSRYLATKTDQPPGGSVSFVRFSCRGFCNDIP